MKYELLLAWRHIAHQRARSAILVLCILLTTLLPAAVQVLVHGYGESMRTRAQTTPLVVGAPGGRYDLVLAALYFRGRVPRSTSMAEVDEIEASGLGTTLPLLARRSASGFPIVGTTPEYLAFRELRIARGTPPRLLGDAVLGSEAARRLALGPGDTLLSDRGSLYDLTAGYPLCMQVVGVLEETGAPEDSAVLVDLKTAWVIEGIGHGHADSAALDPSAVLKQGPDGVVLDASVVEHTRVTPQNIDTFHFHAAPADLPLSAVLVLPRDARASTQLKGRYRVSDSAQLLVPSEVIEELTGFVFRIKRFFDANALLVSVSTLLLLVLVVMLDLRLRAREFETLRRIGCARGTVARLVATELGLIAGTGLAGAAALALLLAWALGRAVERGALSLL